MSQVNKNISIFGEDRGNFFIFFSEEEKIPLYCKWCTGVSHPSDIDSDLFYASLIPECMNEVLYLEFLSIEIYNILNPIISVNLDSLQS